MFLDSNRRLSGLLCEIVRVTMTLRVVVTKRECLLVDVLRSQRRNPFFSALPRIFRRHFSHKITYIPMPSDFSAHGGMIV